MDLNDHSPAFNENSLEKTMVIGAPVKIEVSSHFKDYLKFCFCNRTLSWLCLIIVGDWWRCRRAQQCHWILHYESRPRQHIWHWCRHRRNKAEALHQVHGHSPEYHQSERLYLVCGCSGQRQRLTILQHHHSDKDWHHRSGKWVFISAYFTENPIHLKSENKNISITTQEPFLILIYAFWQSCYCTYKPEFKFISSTCML